MIDIIKGLGILSVLAFHSEAPLPTWITLFHMAIFFIASGYCYNPNYSDSTNSLKLFIKKRLKSLYLPYIICMVLYSILHNTFINLNIYTDNPEIINIVGTNFGHTTPYWSLSENLTNIIKILLLHGDAELGGAMWFFATLFEISILYILIEFCLKHLLKKHSLLILSILSLLFLVLGFICQKNSLTLMGLDRTLSFFILFHIGSVFNRKNFFRNNHNNIFHIFAFIISYYVIIFSDKEGTVALNANGYTNPIFLLLVSTAGWFIFYEVAYFLNKTKSFSKVISYLGKNTTPVVAMHFLAFKPVNLLYGIVNNYPLCIVAAFPVVDNIDGYLWILYLSCGLAIPLLLNKFYSVVKTKLFPITKYSN